MFDQIPNTKYNVCSKWENQCLLRNLSSLAPLPKIWPSMEQVSFSSPVSVMGVIDDDADDDGHKLKSLMMTAILQSDLYSGVHMYFSSHQIVFPKREAVYFCLNF